MIGSELYAFYNAANGEFQRQIVGFVTRHGNDAEDFMVVGLRGAAQHQAEHEAGGNHKNGFHEDSLSGEQSGEE